MTAGPLGDSKALAEALARLAATIDARSGADPSTSYTAQLLADPMRAAKKLGEEGLEAALAVAAQGDAQIAAEAADVIYHLLAALRSRGVALDDVAAALARREGVSGLAEKAARKP